MGPLAALFVVVVFLLFSRGSFGGDYEIKTKDDYTYTVTPFWVTGLDYIAFRVEACNDAHVLLMNDADDEENKIYEIVIGGLSNSLSVIRKAKQGTPPLATKTGDSPLNCNEFRPFWISWYDSTIRVGAGLMPGSYEFLTYLDPTPTAINSWAVATGWGATGVWIVGSSCIVSGDPHLYTTSGLRYRVGLQGLFELIYNNIFEVIANFVSCRQGQASCLGATTISVIGSNTWYELQSKNILLISGNEYTGDQYSDNNVEIHTNQDGRWKYMVQTRYGTNVHWSGGKALKVILAMNYYGNTFGLCGTFTDVKANDLTLRNGTVTKDVNAFIANWEYGP